MNLVPQTPPQIYQKGYQLNPQELNTLILLYRRVVTQSFSQASRSGEVSRSTVVQWVTICFVFLPNLIWISIPQQWPSQKFWAGLDTYGARVQAHFSLFIKARPDSGNQFCCMYIHIEIGYTQPRLHRAASVFQLER